MSTDRLARVNEVMRREIGEALYHVLQDYELDLSSLTVTHVSTSSNLRTAHVYVSIREHAEERQAMLRRLARHAGDIQKLINAHLKLKYTPKLVFVLNESIEKGDRVLNLLRQMNDEAGTDDAEPDMTEPTE